MARYTGPKVKIERREGVNIYGKNKRQRKDLPGSGARKTPPSRPGEYAVQMRETQRLKRTYGLLEKQFTRVIKQALKSTGNSGTRLLQLMEMRLDNVVFRLNFAKSRLQARQFVNHGHVKVNGKKLDIPSYVVQVGDEVEIDSELLSKISQTFVPGANEQDAAKWLEKTANSGKILDVPQRADLDQSINERLIIEFYSR